MTKRKQNKKAGKVIRMSDFAWNYISKTAKGQSICSAVDELISKVIDQENEISIMENGKKYFMLPDLDKLFISAAEARGFAIILAVKAGKGAAPLEPIEVRLIAS